MKKDKTILIVDDDERVARMLVRRLKKTGVTIHVAMNGKIGYEKALELQPDMILLDIQMPLQDGYSTIVALREVGYEGLVVACTASVRAKDTAKAIEKGCDYFIAKPIGKNFEIIINELLEKGRDNNDVI